MAEYTKNGHRSRLRDKCIHSGFKHLSERDKLELLLFYAIPRIDTKPIAHALLDQFKTIGSILDAPAHELTKIDGIGPNAALLLKLIPELIHDYSKSKVSEISFAKSEDICNFFINEYISEINEVFKAAYLDDKLRLIECVDIAEGYADSVEINIRKLIEYTYKYNSLNIIISHNHPNSDANPSNKDIKMTNEMYKILKPLGINLLDHIIVSGNNAISLKNIGAFTMFTKGL